jgi:hypothetical protein
LGSGFLIELMWFSDFLKKEIGYPLGEMLIQFSNCLSPLVILVDSPCDK